MALLCCCISISRRKNIIRTDQIFQLGELSQNFVRTDTIFQENIPPRADFASVSHAFSSSPQKESERLGNFWKEARNFYRLSFTFRFHQKWTMNQHTKQWLINTILLTVDDRHDINFTGDSSRWPTGVTYYDKYHSELYLPGNYCNNCIVYCFVFSPKLSCLWVDSLMSW